LRPGGGYPGGVIMKQPGWEEWEAEANEILGTKPTIHSGNQWHDPSDGKSDYGDSFPLLVDAKYTTNASFSVSAKFMGQNVDRALEKGKRFILAIRLRPKGSLAPREYVVLGIDDFAELLAAAKQAPVAVDRTFLEVDDYRRA